MLNEHSVVSSLISTLDEEECIAMRIFRSYKRTLMVESLEQRLTLGTMTCSNTIPLSVFTRAVSQGADLPPPDPEPDPGPFPGDDPPIGYPPVPPSGPVGPGHRYR